MTDPRDAVLRAVLDAGPVGVGITRLSDDVTIYANARLDELLGYTGVAVHTHGHWANPEDRQRFLAAYARGACLANREVQFRRTDGSTFWGLLTWQPTRYADAECVLFWVVDIDALKQAQSILTRAKESAEAQRAELEERLRHTEKLDAVGRLASCVAHDFGNTLAVVSDSGELALDALGPEHPARGDLARLLEAARTATELTEQLLALSGREVLVPAALELNQIVTEMCRLLGSVVGDRVELELALADDVGPVRADRSELEQVCLNLAVNAREAMPNGGRLRVTTANALPGSADEGYVLLEVAHGGVGDGAGQGLETVHGIVDRSGGRMEIESAPEEGTRVRIHLRAAYTGPLSAPVAAVPPTREGAVLLVEDNESVRRVVRRMLEHGGYSVLEAADGAQALELAGDPEVVFRLLLIDLVMPQLSGREVASRIAELHPGVPTLFMSGYSDDAVVGAAPLPGEAALLKKPFGRPVLLERVAAVLTGSAHSAEG